MIQELNATFHNAYTPRDPKEDDVVFYFEQDHIFLTKEGTFLTVKDYEETSDFIYLFEIDETAFYLTTHKHRYTHVLPIFEMRSYEDALLRFASVTAYHLSVWIRENKYCGSCGKEMTFSNNERALVCKACGHIVYPRLNPAVIVGILNKKNQLLVTKYTNRPYTHYALVAGYAEIGETIEECVKREVKEETGLSVSNLRYVTSQPWAFSQSLLFGFWCDTEEEEISFDHHELQLAEWKERGDEIGTRDQLSLTAYMISLFQKGEIHYGS